MLVNGIERYKTQYGSYPRFAFMDAETRQEALKQIAELPEGDKATKRTIKRTQLVERSDIKYQIRFGMSEKDF